MVCGRPHGTLSTGHRQERRRACRVWPRGPAGGPSTRGQRVPVAGPVPAPHPPGDHAPGVRARPLPPFSTGPRGGSMGRITAD